MIQFEWSRTPFSNIDSAEIELEYQKSKSAACAPEKVAVLEDHLFEVDVSALEIYPGKFH